MAMAVRGVRSPALRARGGELDPEGFAALAGELAIPAGELYDSGWNANGQLGHGDLNTRISPQRVDALDGVTAVACGSRVTAVLASGRVYTTGRGDDGQLGQGDRMLAKTPALVAGLAGVDIVAVACRGAHCLALSREGEAFAWGDNHDGQCGTGKTKVLRVPTFISNLRNIVVTRIACGRQHSLALSATSALYSWGSNEDGATGLGKTRGITQRPQRVAALSSVAVVSIACGSRHSLAVTNTGDAYTWGWGFYGQLGNGNTSNSYSPSVIQVFKRKGLRVRDVAAGYRHSFAVVDHPTSSGVPDLDHPSDSDDTSSSDDSASETNPKQDVWGWGWNSHKQLGIAGRKTRVLTPVRVPGLQSVTVKALAAGGRHSICVIASQFTQLSRRTGTATSAAGSVSSQYDSPAPSTRRDGLGVGTGMSGVTASPTDIRGHGDALGSPPGHTGASPLTASPLLLGMPHDDTSSGTATLPYGTLGASSLARQLNQSHISELRGVAEGDERSDDDDSDGTDEKSQRHSLVMSPGLRASSPRSGGLIRTPPFGSTLARPTSSGHLSPERRRRDSGSECSQHDSVAGGVALPKLLGDVPTPDRPGPGGLVRSPSVGMQATDVVLTFGKNTDGELALADVRPRATPTPVTRLPHRAVLAVACGWAHTAFVVAPSGPAEVRQRQVRRSRKHNCVRWCCRQAPWVTSGDWDAAATQLLNGLVQLMLAFVILMTRCGLNPELISRRVLPALGLSYLLGNSAFFALSHYVAWRHRRVEGTALPHGVNTLMLFAIAVYVMGPVFDVTNDAEIALETGVAACLLTGVISAILVPMIRAIENLVPRAALLTPLAGLGLTMVAMGAATSAFSSPLFGLPPVIMLLAMVVSNVRLPLGVPSALGAIALGTGAAWISYSADFPHAFVPYDGEGDGLGLSLPGLQFGTINHAIRDGHVFRFLGIIVPLSVVNSVTQLHNLDAAKSVGDVYSGTQALVIDSLVTIVSALMGSPFPTCVFMGHAKVKASGARTSYGFLAAVVLATACFTSGIPLVLRGVPLSSGLGLILWVGVQVTGWAFNRDKAAMTTQSVAVAVGLLPAMAAWCLQMIQAALQTRGDGTHVDMHYVLETMQTVTGRGGMGLGALAHGFVTTSLVLATTFVWVVEREFLRAAAWMGIAAGLAFVGLIHSYEFGENGTVISAPLGSHEYGRQFASVYGLAAIGFVVQHWRERDRISEAWCARLTRSCRLGCLRGQQKATTSDGSDGSEAGPATPLISVIGKS